MKKIKIVFLEHCIDNTVGGSHYCLLEICRALDKERYDATLIFYQENDLIPEFKQTGFKVRIERPFKSARFGRALPALVGKLIRFPVNYYRMIVTRMNVWRKILKQENADILHLNNTFSTDHDALIAAKSLGIPVVAHIRGIEVKISKLSVFLSRFIEKIIVISNAVKQNLLDKGISDRNMRWIYDGIREERITEGVKERYLFSQYHLKPDHIVFGVVGNIKAWKGQRLLVEAASLLKQRHDRFYCFLVGDISEKAYHDEILGLVEANGLQEHVILTGYQKNVADFVNSFDIFVHTSVKPEPFGIVILEALALRKPVIVSNIGAPKEIIENGESGLLFDIKSPEDLMEKLDFLIQDAGKREHLGSQGYLRFKNNFTIKKNVDAIYGVYQDILK